MRSWCWILHAAGAGVALSDRPGQAQSPSPAAVPTAMPIRYDEHRFIVVPVTVAGDTLALYTDTGAEINMIFPAAVERLGLPRDSITRAGETRPVTILPAWRPGASIPFGSPNPEIGRRILVHNPIDFAAGTDGLLGGDWFGNHVWTFDYPHRQLLLRSPGDLPRHVSAHRVSLGFQTDSVGQRTTNFPRIRVRIDGDSLDLLFDTGAMTALTAKAQTALGDGRPRRRAASFIITSVFERWRRRHPTWRIIQDADELLDTTYAMLEVPHVSVGGFVIGPVWFTARPDPNFAHLSRWMDRPIVGALGGSALHYLQVTVDYPGAVAVFARP